MEKSFRIAAIDVGNDALKGYLGDEKQSLYIPNVLAEIGEDREVVELEKDPLSGLHVQVLSGALSKGKGVYAVGKLATSFANNDELTASVDKSESDQPIVLLLTALAYDAATKYSGDTIDVVYALSTGLPLSEAKKGKRQFFKEKLMNNQHEVTFLQTPKLGGKRVRIKFEHVLVNTEGYAALVDLTTNDDGSLRNEELTKMDVMIVDIGGLSTDAAIIKSDGNIDNHHSDGIREGISPYLDEIRMAVEKEFKLPYFKSRRDVVETLTHPNAEERGHIWLRGKRVSIQHIYRPILQRLAKEEYKWIEQIWERVPSIRRAYLIGGGALILKPYLEEINEEKGQYPLHFLDPEHSLWIIARAYYKLMVFYLQQKQTV